MSGTRSGIRTLDLLIKRRKEVYFRNTMNELYLYAIPCFVPLYAGFPS